MIALLFETVAEIRFVGQLSYSRSSKGERSISGLYDVPLFMDGTRDKVAGNRYSESGVVAAVSSKRSDDDAEEDVSVLKVRSEGDGTKSDTRNTFNLLSCLMRSSSSSCLANSASLFSLLSAFLDLSV